MSFTAFNAPIQQRPKPAPIANINGTLSLAQSAFSDRPDLVKRLQAIACQGDLGSIPQIGMKLI